jgi:hypothetical protein
MSPKNSKTDIIYEIKKPLYENKAAFIYSASIRTLFLSTSITPPLISKN